MRKSSQVWISILLVAFATVAASAQSFRVQCPTTTITHPNVANSEPAYSGPTQFGTQAITQTGTSMSGGYVVPTANTNGTIKCQQISGGDGYMTEADGTQTFMFSFGPLSGLADVAAGLPSTQFPSVFNTTYTAVRGVPAPITVATEAPNASGTPTVTITSTLNPRVNDAVIITGVTTLGYNGTFTVTGSSPTSFTYAVPAALTTPGVLGTTPTAQDLSGPTRGDPATTDGATAGNSPGTAVPGAFTWNGAVGLMPDVAYVVTVSDLLEGPFPATTPITTAPGCDGVHGVPAGSVPTANTVTAWTDAPFSIPVGQQVVITNATAEGGTTTPGGYSGTWTVTCVANAAATTPSGFNQYAFQYQVASTTTGLASDTGNDLAATASSPAVLDGHVDPRQIMDVGVMNGNIPAPLAAFDEDDEFFLTLTNVGMIMRPDLFEQHTVHFHGYPNASSFYDGVPDASIAINIGASFTYYYLAPDAGTYFWHCHITPPEHLQMGMVGQLHVRPRQDRVPSGGSLYTYLGYQNGIGLPSGTVADLRTECNPGRDILCSATMPAVPNTVTTARSATNPTTGVQGDDLVGNPQRYTYNDGDGSTAFDVQYPIQMHGFDPNFHFVGMTFNPELFVDMKDKYFLLNGRSYPDTVGACGAAGVATTSYTIGCVAGPQATVSTDGQMHYSQPLPAVINIPVGGKALLRMVNLSVTEYHTLQSVGIPMLEVGFMAKLLRDQAGNNTEFYTNSITLGGGESLDVILDASDAGCVAFAGTGCAAKLYPANSTFYLYTPQLDHLSNDAENFGGMMTEVHICNSVTSSGSSAYLENATHANPPGSTFGNTCN